MPRKSLKEEWKKLSKHPHLHSLWMKMRLYMRIPFLILFKVMDIGLYKVLINDKYGIPVYTGYTWCNDEYLFTRKKRVKADLKARKMDFPDDIFKVKFINLSHLIREESLPEITETIMWTKADFVISSEAQELSSRLYSLHDNIIKIIKNVASSFKEKIKVERKKVPLLKKIASSITRETNLLEVSFLDYEEKCAFKCFIFSKNDDKAFSIIKEDLKTKMVDLKDIKEVLFKTYKGKDFGVIWVTNLIKK
jgi:hypothetical protein